MSNFKTYTMQTFITTTIILTALEVTKVEKWNEQIQLASNERANGNVKACAQDIIDDIKRKNNCYTVTTGNKFSLNTIATYFEYKANPITSKVVKDIIKACVIV